MRKIAICTPVKAGLDTNYMLGLVPTLLQRYPGVELEFYMLGGTCVSFARNELVYNARRAGCGEIFFIDSDMGWNTEHFNRMISHEDYDIIAGLYCKRKPGAPVWLMNKMADAEIDPVTSICEVEDIATGFMKIKIATVFPRLEAMFPHLEFEIEERSTGKKTTCWEFFRIGCDGPRTPEARLNRIKSLLLQEVSAEAMITRVTEACYDQQPPSVLRGEDYYFCKMAREAGLQVYADFGLPPIPHIGDVSFPIVPEMVGLHVKGQLAPSPVQS